MRGVESNTYGSARGSDPPASLPGEGPQVLECVVGHPGDLPIPDDIHEFPEAQPSNLRGPRKGDGAFGEEPQGALLTVSVQTEVQELPDGGGSLESLLAHELLDLLLHVVGDSCRDGHFGHVCIVCTACK